MAERNTLTNKRAKTKAKNVIKKFQQAIVSGETEKAGELAIVSQKAIDKAWKKGALHKNTASRRKSTLMKKLAN